MIVAKNLWRAAEVKFMIAFSVIVLPFVLAALTNSVAASYVIALLLLAGYLIARFNIPIIPDRRLRAFQYSLFPLYFLMEDDKRFVNWIKMLEEAKATTQRLVINKPEMNPDISKAEISILQNLIADNLPEVKYGDVDWRTDNVKLLINKRGKLAQLTWMYYDIFNGRREGIMRFGKFITLKVEIDKQTRFIARELSDEGDLMLNMNPDLLSDFELTYKFLSRDKTTTSDKDE